MDFFKICSICSYSSPVQTISEVWQFFFDGFPNFVEQYLKRWYLPWFPPHFPPNYCKKLNIRQTCISFSPAKHEGMFCPLYRILWQPNYVPFNHNFLSSTFVRGILTKAPWRGDWFMTPNEGHLKSFVPFKKVCELQTNYRIIFLAFHTLPWRNCFVLESFKIWLKVTLVNIGEFTMSLGISGTNTNISKCFCLLHSNISFEVNFPTVMMILVWSAEI